MSRIAKNPVNIPAGVDATIGGGEITVKGSLGTLSQRASKLVNVRREGDSVVFEAADKSIAAKAMSGTLRSLVANMVTGVSSGFEKKLALVGVGYRAQAQGARGDDRASPLYAAAAQVNDLVHDQDGVRQHDAGEHDHAPQHRR